MRNKLLLFGIFMLSVSIPCYAQFIDAGFGTGPFGKKQFFTGLFGTGSGSGGGGGLPNNAMTFKTQVMTFNGNIMTFSGTP